MDKADLKADLKADRNDLYSPPAARFVEVDVPAMTFLAVDGTGNPNSSQGYREAVEALFAVSYAVKFASKREVGRDYVVMPLEGLWTADDLTAFVRRDKDAWSWTMLIRQPDWVEPAMLARAQDGARAKALPALPRLYVTTLTEGLCVQRLHLGSYDDEGPVLRELHEEYLPAQGLVPAGRHHEVYLGDPRRVAPERLRTVLRQPVARVGSAPSLGRSHPSR
jgi:hypothetical protein